MWIFLGTISCGMSVSSEASTDAEGIHKEQIRAVANNNLAECFFISSAPFFTFDYHIFFTIFLQNKSMFTKWSGFVKAKIKVWYDMKKIYINVNKEEGLNYENFIDWR